MTSARPWVALVALLASWACGAGAQQETSGLVVSSDPELGALAAGLLEELADRSGLSLREPVRLEKRSREELVRYLEYKLDEELPVDEARDRVDAYALLGLVPPDLDLRGVLMGLYTEQVAGFYEPDSTALFVMDDQPDALLQGLLVHELVHAIQDQNVDLDALTDPALGNDRAIAAQAAIEGHATLVMLEFMTAQMTGADVDLSAIPNFAEQMRPALQGMRAQFPALASAPRVIQEALLFPYLEGAGFVQRLWTRGARVAPFGEYLPGSTEQVLVPDAAPPVDLTLDVQGGSVVHEDMLGRLELGVLIAEHFDGAGADLADGWEGDRYVLVDAGGGRGLVWYALWEDATSRDRFATAVEGSTGRFGGPVTLARTDVLGRAATVLRIGELGGVTTVARARNP